MTTKLNHWPVAVVAGAGPGNGQALARRFAEPGYAVALLAHDLARVTALASEISDARGYACDVGDAGSVSAAFTNIRGDLGEVDALLYNAGSGVFADVGTITPEQFEASWRVNALGALLCAKEAIPHMVQTGMGDIVFIGDTASRRGGATQPPSRQPRRPSAASRNRWRESYGRRASMSRSSLLTAWSTRRPRASAWPTGPSKPLFPRYHWRRPYTASQSRIVEAGASSLRFVLFWNLGDRSKAPTPEDAATTKKFGVFPGKPEKL